MGRHNHYKRRYRRKGKGVRGWKRKKAPKSSALVRQTEQNRKEITKLKKLPEIKFCGSTTATAKSNFCGHVMQQQEVDAYGLGMSSADWLGITQPRLDSADTELYAPVWQMPIVVQQGVGEKQRIGNKIKMKSLIIKGTIVGGRAEDNAGIYTGVQVKQFVHMFVILDKNPVPENPTLTTVPFTPVYSIDATPGQTFSYGANWGPSASSLGTVAFQTNLKSCPGNTANPPGLHCGNDSDMDNVTNSYWSRDNDGIGKSDRFKLLKHCKYRVLQQMQNNDADSKNSPTAHHFTEVIKAPYVYEFSSDKNVTPDNQRLYLVFVSNAPTKRSTSSGGPTPTWTDPTDYVMPPKVSTLTRLYFTDS